MWQLFKVPNPGIGGTWIIWIVAQILGGVLPLVTPSLKKALESFLLELYEKSVENMNPWDDFLIRFIMRFLGMKVPGDTE